MIKIGGKYIGESVSSSQIGRSFESPGLKLFGHCPTFHLPVGRQSRPVQCGATRRDPCNQRSCYASSVWLRLRRAALKGRLRRLGGRCEWNQRPNSSKAKVSNHPLICDFSADYPILHSKGRTVVIALPAAREADVENLSKFAV